MSQYNPYIYVLNDLWFTVSISTVSCNMKEDHSKSNLRKERRRTIIEETEKELKFIVIHSDLID